MRDEDTEVAVRRRTSSSTTPRLRPRTSVPVYGQRNKRINDDSSDDSDIDVSLHRDPLHRHNTKLTWRDHWQPTSANRRFNADRINNNNNNNNSKYSNSDTLSCHC